MEIRVRELVKGTYRLETPIGEPIGTFELDIDGFYYFYDNKNKDDIGDLTIDF